jgi:biotin carboxylase
MSIKTKSILIFGGGDLQHSIIEKCRKLNFFAVVIDPNPNAEGKNLADAFEMVEGGDFEKTCSVVEKYSISALITAATDKPLVMMAKIAEKFNLPFFSEETAITSTDKFLMKKVFEENNIPCASGSLVTEINDSHKYPLILKPRDNSGSRGIIFCRTKQHLSLTLRWSNKSFADDRKNNDTASV